MDGEFTFVCVCNGRYYGGGFNPVPQADPADGLLDVLLLKKVSRMQVPFVIGKYKSGRYDQMPRLVRHFKTQSITIRCDGPTPINLDGELRTGETITMKVSDKKVRFFYPLGLRWRAEA